MNDQRESPPSVGEPQRQDAAVSLGRVLSSIGMTVFAALMYAKIYQTAPAFADLFAGFGTSLNVFTRSVLAAAPYFGWLLPIALVPTVLLVIRRVRREPADKGIFAIVVAGFCIAIVLSGAFEIAVYLPVFQMDSVIPQSVSRTTLSQ